MQKNIQNIGHKLYTKTLAHPKNSADTKTLAHPKSLADAQNLAHLKSLADAKNLAHPKSLADAKTLAHLKSRHLQKCWRSRKSRQTRWRIASLFRLGRICNCWILSGPADGLVLLLADVWNRVHVDFKWGMVPQCPAFMGGLSPILYRLLVPARHASKWSNIWRRPNLWCLPEISLVSVKPKQSISAHRCPIKKWWTHKWSPSLSNVSSYIHDL